MARKQHKYHYIYKITCLKNNKYYIGMHSTDNLDDGYLGGGVKIKNSIKKHGKDKHKKIILEFYENRDLLKEREKELVNEELLNDPMCMNLVIGGEGGIFNNEHHLKMREGASKWAKEKWKDPDFFINNRNISSERFKNLHKEGKMIYDTFSNKSHSEESILKMKESHKEKHKGEKNSQFGTIWITNWIENKKIRKEDIIPENWKKGRI